MYVNIDHGKYLKFVFLEKFVKSQQSKYQPKWSEINNKNKTIFKKKQFPNLTAFRVPCIYS